MIEHARLADARFGRAAPCATAVRGRLELAPPPSVPSCGRGRRSCRPRARRARAAARGRRAGRRAAQPPQDVARPGPARRVGRRRAMHSAFRSSGKPSTHADGATAAHVHAGARGRSQRRPGERQHPDRRSKEQRPTLTNRTRPDRSPRADACSGDMYAIVPDDVRRPALRRRPGAASLDERRSRGARRARRGATSTFDGLMSRCTLPAACSARHALGELAQRRRARCSKSAGDAARPADSSPSSPRPPRQVVARRCTPGSRRARGSAARVAATCSTWRTKSSPSTSSIVKNHASARHSS